MLIWACAIDEVVTDRVLVFGSLPPNGRDLDLLARRRQATEIELFLRGRGFSNHGRHWGVVDGCRGFSVEVVPASRWGLSDVELEQLYAHALPIADLRYLVRPSPHHALLIASRRLVLGEGRLDEKRRARVDAVLAEHPDAWADARRLAPAWGLNAGLRQLQRALAADTAIRVRDRARARAEIRIAARQDHTNGRVFRLRRPHRRHGYVLALSGLDGAGKTVQGEALRGVLETLGMEVAIEWSRFGSRISNPSLRILSSPVKWMMGSGRPAAKAVASPKTGHTAGELAAGRTPGSVVFARSSALKVAWTLIATLANGASHRRGTRRHLRQGRVVICDRYELDSLVSLRHRYEPASSPELFRVHRLLLRALSPRPLRAYLLEVTPETAVARKTIEFRLPDLRRLADLYREESLRLGVRVIDAERPPEDVCHEIASDAWRAISAEEGRSGTLIGRLRRHMDTKGGTT